MTREENCPELVVKLLNSNLNVKITQGDISVTHRLGPIKASGSPNRRNIYVKFCRRDLAKTIISTSKQQKKPNFYCNESLTPLRRSLFHGLRKMKNIHPEIVKGCTTQAGRVFAFTAPVGTSKMDQKHHICNMDDLRVFCETYVKVDMAQLLKEYRGDVSK